MIRPEGGVALFELSGHWTPGLSEAFHVELSRAGFEAAYPGYLPVVHRLLRQEDVPQLPLILREAFAFEEPISIPAQSGWAEALRLMLSQSPSSGPTASAATVLASHVVSRSPFRSQALLAGALAVGFVLGALSWSRPWQISPPVAERASITPASAAPPALNSEPDAPAEGSRSSLAANMPAVNIPMVTAPAAQRPVEAPTAALLPPALHFVIPSWAETAFPILEGETVFFLAASHQAVLPAEPLATEPAAATIYLQPLPPPSATSPLDPTPGSLAPPPEAGALLTASPAELAPPPVAGPGILAPLPHASLPPAPLPTTSPPASTADPALVTRLLRRGDELLALGDISGARRLLERAEAAGSASAALRLAETYDPRTLPFLNARGLQPDPAAALAWYRRAEVRGASVDHRIRALEAKP